MSIHSSMRREIERAIDEAVNPSYMAVHSGIARIDSSYLRRLLAIADETIFERDALRAERDALRDALLEYSHHKASCSIGNINGHNGDCDCGLDAAIDAARGDK